MRWGKIRRAASEGSHRRHIAAAPTILIPLFAPLLDDHHGDASSSSSSSAEKGEKTVVDYSIGEVGDRTKGTLAELPPTKYRIEIQQPAKRKMILPILPVPWHR